MKEQSLLKIFFLCEDVAAMDRAVKLKGNLVGQCQGRVLIEANFCEFARLCHPRLRENAAEQVAETDMLVVSSNGTHGLPPFVQNWLKEVTPQKEKLACASFVRTDLMNRVDHQFLQEWSRQNGATFFNSSPPEERDDCLVACG